MKNKPYSERRFSRWITPLVSTRWHSFLFPVLIVLSLLLANRAQAVIRHVPAQYATIQAAINASLSGDEIVVADGIWTGPGNVNLTWVGKDLHVHSANGYANCIIDGGNSARAFVFNFDQLDGAVITSLTVIEGFTMRYCNPGDLPGGAIMMDHGYSSNNLLYPTIRNNYFHHNTARYGGAIRSYYGAYPTQPFGLIYGNIFENNHATIGGGAIELEYTEMHIYNNQFISNSTGNNGTGGAISIYNGSIEDTDVKVYGNLFQGNSAPGSVVFGHGGAIYVAGMAWAEFNNNIFAGNSAFAGGGAFCSSHSFISLKNNLFYENSVVQAGSALLAYNFGSMTVVNCSFIDNSGPEVVNVTGFNGTPNLFFSNSIIRDLPSPGNSFSFTQAGTVSVTYSNIEGGAGASWFGLGCIDQNPLFVNAAAHNYHLMNNSPCIQHGTLTGAPSTDLDGLDRPTPAGTLPDMGVYENSVGAANPCIAVAPMGILEVDPGFSITLSPLVQGGTSPFTFAWSPSAGLSSTQIQNPVSTPSATTTYSLTVTDNLGCQAIQSAIVQVNTPSYCIPPYSVGCNWGDRIDDVMVSNLQHYMSGCSPNDYGDFTSMTAEFHQGQTYTLSVVAEADNVITMWIDFNNNGQFEESERLLDSLLCLNDYYAFSRTFAIPANAMPGVHRMRIRASYSTYGATPCGWGFLGETQDYSAEILAISQPAIACIPIIGLAEEHMGVAAWNANPACAEGNRVGHPCPQPPASIQYAWYYLASRDWSDIDTLASVGFKGQDTIQGFPNLVAALDLYALNPDALRFRFGYADLDDDVEGTNWTLVNDLETRYYTGGTYSILLNDEVIAGGATPMYSQFIDYNLYQGYTDSIYGYTGFNVPADSSAGKSAMAQAIAAALLSDIGQAGIRMVFESMQPALQMEFGGNGRFGGFFDIQKGRIERGPDPVDIPILELGNDTAVCIGQNFQLDASDAFDSYLWSNGKTTWQITENPGVTTTYGVTVTFNGQSFSDEITVTMSDVEVSAIITSPQNGNNGAIDISAFGATAPYSFIWSNGATTEDLAEIGPGVYGLTVVDFYYCGDHFSFDFTEPCDLTLLPMEGLVINPGGTAVLNPVVAGGMPPLTYSWSPGEGLDNPQLASPTASPLVSTTYSLTVTDVSGCSATGNVLVEVMNPEYCIPAYYVGCVLGDYIDDVTLADLSNTNTACSPNGYGDFSQMAAHLSAGESYTMTVSCGYSGEKILGWIDLNDDHTFSEDELLAGPLDCVQAGVPYEMTLTLPVDANPGSHRMRVRAVWSINVFTPCGTYSYGEAEDYSVIITGPEPDSEFIPIIGLSAEHMGTAAWNANPVCAEGIEVGHLLPQPPASIEVAYYYLASRDWSDIDPLSTCGFRGKDTVQGFPNLMGALALYGLDPTALKFSYGVADLDEDLQGLNWSLAGNLETRIYTGGTYSIRLNEEVILGGNTPPYTQFIEYHAWQGQVDSIYGYTGFDIPADSSAGKSAMAQAVAAALLQDIGVFGIRMVFESMQPAFQMELSGNGRYGGFFDIHKGKIEKGSVPLVVPELNLGNNMEACAGSSLTLVAGPGYETYHWSNGATTPQLTVTPLNTTLYSVTVTSGTSVLTDEILINVHPLFLNLSTTPTAMGNQGAITLSVTGGTPPYSFFWNNGATTEDLTSLPAGQYSVTVTDGNQCSTIGNTSITSSCSLNLSPMANPTILPGQSIQLYVGVTGGQTPYTYYWWPSVDLSNYAIPSPIATPAATTAYHVQVTDASGCYASSQITVQVGNPVYCQPGYYSGCSWGDYINDFHFSNLHHVGSGCSSGAYGDFTSFSASVTPASEYVMTLSSGYSNQYVKIWVDWNNDGTFDTDEVLVSGWWIDQAFTQSSQTVSIPAGIPAGMHRMRVRMVWGNNGFSACGDANFGECHDYMLNVGGTPPPPDPILNLPASLTACNGDPVTLNAGPGFASYLWSNGSTTQSNTLYPLSSGLFSVTVAGASGQIQTDATHIELVTLSIGANTSHPETPGNPSGSITISVSGGTTPYQYGWSNGSTQAVNGTLLPGSYLCTITEANGCSAIYEGTVILCDFSPTFTGIPTETPLTYQFNPIETINPDSFQASWSFGDGLGSTALNPIHTYTAPGTYSVYVQMGYFDGYASCYKTYSLQVTVQPPVQSQVLSLGQGWNMISTFIQPTNPGIWNVFAPIQSNIVLMKNGIGQIFWPAFGVNSIGNLTNTDGYQLKMTSAQSLSISGSLVNPTTTALSFPTGWSMRAYLRTSPAPIASILAPLGSTVNVVKNNAGAIYWPTFGVNLIGNLIPGQGYQFNLSSLATYYYPANTSSIAKEGWTGTEANTFNTGENMHILIPADAWDELPRMGGIVQVEGPGGLVAGYGKFSGTNLALTIWGDDPTTEISESLKAGQKFDLIWVDPVDHGTTPLEMELATGQALYEKDDLLVATKIKKAAIHQLTSTLSISPNPGSDHIQFGWFQPANAIAKLCIYNSLGELVEELSGEKCATGWTTIPYEAGHLPVGSYLCRLESAGKVLTTPLHIVR